MISDNQLVLNVLNGDTDSYSELMNRYHNEIYKYVYNIVGDFNYSDDLVQEIFIKVFNKINTFDSNKAGYRTWLYRVSHNYTMNFMKTYNRRRKAETKKDIDDIFESKEDIEASIVRDEKVKNVIKAIEKVLKQKAKKIMYLHFFSELSPSEISEVTKIPVQTIYKSLHASIEKIKKEVNLNEKN